MSTTRSFQDMLNEYLPNSLLREELIKRDYILSNVKKDNKWKGGKIPVPFKASGASSVKLGGLTAGNDIAESKFVRGSIDEYKEVWGSMIFHHRDILDHSGRIKEDSFIRTLPDTIEDFSEYMKTVMSVQLGTGPSFAKAMVNPTAGGVVKVDRIDRFMLDQKVIIEDDDSAPLALYVIAINLNADTVTFSATRAGGAADLTAYTVAQNAKFFHDGGEDTSNQFTSLRSALLPAANGGSATLHGKSKLLYPFLQAIAVDGSSITASNIVQKIFEAYVVVRVKARGNADTVLMSFENLGSAMQVIEYGPTGSNGKSPFKVSEGSSKASMYGWDEIEILQMGSRKRLKFVGIQEWDNDTIVFLDWSAICFRSNGFIQKRTAPDGKQYYETRTTAGFAYILDSFCFGELEVKAPNRCGIIYGIAY
jgi:hypothetical protein